MTAPFVIMIKLYKRIPKFADFFSWIIEWIYKFLLFNLYFYSLNFRYVWYNIMYIFIGNKFMIGFTRIISISALSFLSFFCFQTGIFLWSGHCPYNNQSVYKFFLLFWWKQYLPPQRLISFKCCSWTFAGSYYPYNVFAE